jgi:hypothetical protein
MTHIHIPGLLKQAMPPLSLAPFDWTDGESNDSILLTIARQVPTQAFNFPSDSIDRCRFIFIQFIRRASAIFASLIIRV